MSNKFTLKIDGTTLRLTRAEHDLLLAERKELLVQLLACYRAEWCIGGVVLYNVNERHLSQVKQFAIVNQVKELGGQLRREHGWTLECFENLAQQLARES